MKTNFKRFQKKIKYILISFLGFILLISSFPAVPFLYYILSSLIFLMSSSYYFLNKNFLRLYWLPSSLFSNNRNAIQDILEPSSILPILLITFIQLYLGKISLKVSVLFVLNWLLMRILCYISYQEDLNSGEI